MEHVPVLVDEVLSFINRPGTKTVVDATVGGGGHAEAILNVMQSIRLVGTDQDTDALSRARARLEGFGDRVELRKANFAQLDALLDQLEIDKVDAVLMDLGVSSFHLDDPARGFSFRHPGPLDMRMDLEGARTAEDIVNQANAKELARIFYEYGQERFSRRIAQAIVDERRLAPVTTTDQLARIVSRAIPARGGGARRIHPATRVFQALRIAVNRELDILGPALEAVVERLSPGGRLVVIAFHSLEDRIVKDTFRAMAVKRRDRGHAPTDVENRARMVEILTRKPLRPSEREVATNPRARSAMLRAVEKYAA